MRNVTLVRELDSQIKAVQNEIDEKQNELKRLTDARAILTGSRRGPGRPVGVSAEHICDGGDCGLEPCAETPVHREPGHARAVHPPRDVREQVAMEVYVWEHVRRGAEESWARQRWQTETDGMRDLYFEAADRILALIRTPSGEGEASDLAESIITCIGCGQEFNPDDDAQVRYHEAACEVVDHEPTRVEIARRLRGAALRSEAQGEGDALEMLQASVDEYLWEAQNNPHFDAEAAFASLSREIRAGLPRRRLSL